MPSLTPPSASVAQPKRKGADIAAQPAVTWHRYVIFFAIAGIGCGLDLLTKQWIFQKIGCYAVQGRPVEPPIWLIDGIFGFETSLNEGALFGIGQGRVMLFAGLSIGASIAIIYWLFMAGAARDRLLTVALSLVTGGIFGNLYDRLGFAGLKWTAVRGHEAGDRVYAVRDWLHFKIDALNFDWPIFNIADCLLVCGAALLMWHAWKSRDESTVATGQVAARP